MIYSDDSDLRVRMNTCGRGRVFI